MAASAISNLSMAIGDFFFPFSRVCRSPYSSLLRFVCFTQCGRDSLGVGYDAMYSYRVTGYIKQFNFFFSQDRKAANHGT